MIKIIQRLMLSLALLSVTFHANATILSVEPPVQAVGLGDMVSVDIAVSDLSSAIGDFDFDMSFDDTILTLDSVMFGTGLDLGFFGSIQDDSLVGAGLVNVNELSFEDPADLLAHQLDDFVLFTLNFTAAAFGSSEILFDTVWALGDEFGSTVSLSSVHGGTIRVIDPNSIPNPATYLLMVLALMLLKVKSYRY